MAKKPSLQLIEGIVKVARDPRLLKARASKAKADAASEIVDIREQLRSLTVKELRERAKEWSVDLRGKRRKDEIVEAVASALVKRAEPIKEGRAEEDVDLADLDLPFGRLEDLWIEATKRLDKGDYKSTIALSKDALRILDRWAGRYRRDMCSKALKAAESFTRRLSDNGRSKDLEAKVATAKAAFEQGDLQACSRHIDELQELVADLYVEEVQRVRELLEDRRKALDEMRGISADTSDSRELLSKAEEAMRLEDHAEALDLIHEFDRRLEEAKRRRKEELEEYLRTVESRLAETETLGASLKECRKLIRQARTAFEKGNLVLASEIARRCERTAIEAQRRHIEIALELRKKHYQEVKDLIAHLKPLLEEAQDYGIDVQEARSLIKEALELLRGEDYFLAMEKAEKARDALDGVRSAILAERERRGVVKPEKGMCSQCGSEELVFDDDGWGRCLACGHRFLWSTKEQPRIITFIKRRLVG
jgi:hypothetical protein